jgi:ankyrin repeat protein
MSDTHTINMPSTEEESVARRLHEFIMVSDVRAVESLLKNGANVHGVYEGRTPLHTAAGGGVWGGKQYGPSPPGAPLAIAKLLIDFNADVNREMESSDGSRRTPLHFAAEFRPAGVVQVLIEAGANVSSVDRWGDTPLLRAFALQATDNYYTVRTLIRAGSNVNVADTLGNTVLYNAVFRLQVDVVMLLLKSGAGRSLSVPGVEGVGVSRTRYRTPLERAEDMKKWYSETPGKTLSDSSIMVNILRRAS